MISIEKAKENLFRTSTAEELRAYCKEIGFKTAPNHKTETLVRELCKHFDLSVDAASPVHGVLAAIKPKTDIVPPMDLGPDRWEGKCYRVIVSPPADAHHRDAGVHIYANGAFGGDSRGFPILFNEPIIIPAPVYNRLREIEIQKAYQAEVGTDRVTAFSDPIRKYSVEMLGVQPGTENLPSSMIEWYQQKGPQWFLNKTLREMQTICKKLGLSTTIRNLETRTARESTIEELQSNVMVFLYGYPEVETEEEVAA